MRSAIILSALLGLAAAAPAPAPQDIDFDAVDAAPEATQTAPAAGAPDVVIPYSTASASAAAVEAIQSDPLKLRKRGVNDPCSPQPSSSNPPAGSTDSDTAFLAEPNYASTANSAPVPAGYSLAFKNLQASTQQSGFMRLKTLDSYDPYACQALCDQTVNCVAFNLYVEFDPSLAPAASCPKPDGVTNVKCTLYSLPISAASAKNTGQYRQQFHVVIAGSNGYLKDAPPPAQPGFNGPFNSGCAINAPLAANKVDTFIGGKMFNGAFDPSQCAIACKTQTAYNSRHPAPDGTYKTCAFFNAYVLSENGIAGGTYCSFYTQHWDAKYGVNCGQYRGNDHYTVSNSYTYDLQ